ncbi:unnamed protein product [Closterium sp. Naga37s-1]|nr:unnamed protein product [Closterium sp. Naga37s-1]
MVVLVTGAAGFIGSHLALALKKEGHGVVGLDNFNDYYDTTLKEARAARLWSAGIEIIRGDLNNGTLLDALFATVTFTHVAHMAAQAGVRYALENPKSYVDSNVAGFVNLLERCRRVPERQPAIVWASSSSVYGVNRESFHLPSSFNVHIAPLPPPRCSPHLSTPSPHPPLFLPPRCLFHP